MPYTIRKNRHKKTYKVTVTDTGRVVAYATKNPVKLMQAIEINKHSGGKHSGGKHSGGKRSGGKHSGCKRSGCKRSGCKRSRFRRNTKKIPSIERKF